MLEKSNSTILIPEKISALSRNFWIPRKKQSSPREREILRARLGKWEGYSNRGEGGGEEENGRAIK